MDSSIWIAKLLGPVLLILGIHMMNSPQRLQKTTEKFLADDALIFISGVLAMVAGLSIINSHNVWAWDWRGLITLFGWAFFISGAARIVLPQLTTSVGVSMMDRPLMTRIMGLIWAIFGLVILYKGYG